MGVEQSSININ